MKKYFLIFSLVFISNLWEAAASSCDFTGRTLNDLNKEYDVEFFIKVPFPPKLLEILEKYFGKFSKEQCSKSITTAKINKRNSKEYYLAFYTNDYNCDGGNSYGIIIKGSDQEASHPIAIIEDSYIDCLKR